MNEDIKNIIHNKSLSTYFKISEDIYDKKIGFKELMIIIDNEVLIVKWLIYVLHYLKSDNGIMINNIEYNYDNKCGDILENVDLIKEFNYVYYYNDNRIVWDIFNMMGDSDRYKNYMNKITMELSMKRLNLMISKMNLSLMKCLNDKISDDLIVKITDNLLTHDKNNMKRLLNNKLKISRSLTENYYLGLDVMPENVYCYSWNFNNVDNSLRLNRSDGKKNQILPFVFDCHRNIYFNNLTRCCDRCIYNIDYPRELYLYYKRKRVNRLKGRGVNYLKDWIFFEWCLCCNRSGEKGDKCHGFICKYNRPEYKKKSLFEFNEHLVFKNNISLWMKFTKSWDNIINKD
jgi:hypothetical protein